MKWNTNKYVSSIKNVVRIIPEDPKFIISIRNVS